MAEDKNMDAVKPRPESGIDPSSAPDWWLTRPAKIREFLESLDGFEVEEIGEEGRKYRFVIIPILNVDGRERNPDHEQFINCDLDYYYMICQGLWKNGDVLHWPVPKQNFPMPFDELDILGSYFNDAGVNLVYDLSFARD